MPHNCNRCKYSCVDECVIRLHLIMHNARGAPYKCDECAFIFPTQALLLDHLAVHTNEKPYSCTLCDFVTAVHDKLKDHGMLHRKAFQCNMCWKRFVDRQMLQAHLEEHDNEQEVKKYQCGWCDFKCDQTKLLSFHFGNKHQETYVCDACSVECRTEDGLARHKRQAHKVLEYRNVPNIHDELNESAGMNNGAIIVLDDDNDKNEGMLENFEAVGPETTTRSKYTEINSRKTMVCRKLSAEFSAQCSSKGLAKSSMQSQLSDRANPAVEKLMTMDENAARNCKPLVMPKESSSMHGNKDLVMNPFKNAQTQVVDLTDAIESAYEDLPLFQTPKESRMIRTDDNSIPFKCNLCSFSTNKRRRLKVHLRWHKVHERYLMQQNPLDAGENTYSVLPQFSNELMNILLKASDVTNSPAQATRVTNGYGNVETNTPTLNAIVAQNMGSINILPGAWNADDQELLKNLPEKRLKHLEKRFECNICLQQFQSKNVLHYHKRKRHRDSFRKTPSGQPNDAATTSVMQASVTAKNIDRNAESMQKPMNGLQIGNAQENPETTHTADAKTSSGVQSIDLTQTVDLTNTEEDLQAKDKLEPGAPKRESSFVGECHQCRKCSFSTQDRDILEDHWKKSHAMCDFKRKSPSESNNSADGDQTAQVDSKLVRGENTSKSQKIGDSGLSQVRKMMGFNDITNEFCAGGNLDVNLQDIDVPAGPNIDRITPPSVDGITGPNIDRITGPNIDGITGSNIDGITEPNIDGITGTHFSILHQNMNANTQKSHIHAELGAGDGMSLHVANLDQNYNIGGRKIHTNAGGVVNQNNTINVHQNIVTNIQEGPRDCKINIGDRDTNNTTDACQNSDRNIRYAHVFNTCNVINPNNSSYSNQNMSNNVADDKTRSDYTANPNSLINMELKLDSTIQSVNLHNTSISNMNTDHSNITNLQENEAHQNVEPIEKVFSCKFCSRQCPSKIILKRHQRRHRKAAAKSEINDAQPSSDNVKVLLDIKPIVPQRSVEVGSSDSSDTKKTQKCKKCSLEFQNRKLRDLHYRALHSKRVEAEMQQRLGQNVGGEQGQGRVSQVHNVTQERFNQINQVNENAGSSSSVQANGTEATNIEENLNVNVQPTELKRLFLVSLQATNENVDSTTDIQTVGEAQAMDLCKNSNIGVSVVEATEKPREDDRRVNTQGPNVTRSDSKRYQCPQCCISCISLRSLKTHRRRAHAKLKVDPKALGGHHNRADVVDPLKNVKATQPGDDKNQDMGKAEEACFKQSDHHDSPIVEQDGIATNCEMLTIENIVLNTPNNASNEQEVSDLDYVQVSSVDGNIQSSDMLQAMALSITDASQHFSKGPSLDFVSTDAVPNTYEVGDQNQPMDPALVVDSLMCRLCRVRCKSRDNLKRHFKNVHEKLKGGNLYQKLILNLQVPQNDLQKPVTSKLKQRKPVRLFWCKMCNFGCETRKMKDMHWRLVHSERAQEHLQLLDQLEKHEVEQGSIGEGARNPHIVEPDKKVEMGSVIHISENLETVVTSGHANVENEIVTGSKRANSDATAVVSKRKKLNSVEHRDINEHHKISISDDSSTIMARDDESANSDICIKKENSGQTPMTIKEENLNVAEQNPSSSNPCGSTTVEQENVVTSIVKEEHANKDECSSTTGKLENSDVIGADLKQEISDISIVKEEHTIKEEHGSTVVKNENSGVTAIATKQENLDTSDASAIAATNEQQNVGTINDSLVEERVDTIVIDDD